MSCVGFGPHEGTCENQAEWPSPLWCARCELLRREHLSRRFEEIARLFR